MRKTSRPLTGSPGAIARFSMFTSTKPGRPGIPLARVEGAARLGVRNECARRQHGGCYQKE